MTNFRRKTVLRDSRIDVRVTRAEKDLLVQRASDAGICVSDFLIKAALSRPVRSKTAATIINELIILNDRLKAGSSTATADVLPVLEAVEKLIQSIPMQLEDDLNSP